MFLVLTRKMMPKSHGVEEKVWFREEQHFLHDTVLKESDVHVGLKTWLKIDESQK